MTPLKPFEKKLFRAVQKASTQASKIQKKYYRSNLGFKFKGRVNLITKADLDSQAAIIKTIRKAFPSHHIVAEEKDFGKKQTFKGPTWIIDPLDGTTNFAHRLSQFAISIAFWNEGEIQLGWIHAPILNETFFAFKNKGAYLNGKKIHVSSTKKLKDSFLVTGFAYDRHTTNYNNLDLFGFFEMHSISVRRLGSAALDLAYVAAGRFDGYWEKGLFPWDVAAGILIVLEAGGQVTDFASKPITNLWNKEIVATNAKIHSKLILKTKTYR